MSKDRDEKAEEEYIAQVSGKVGYKKGWDQALESEAVKKLEYIVRSIEFSNCSDRFKYEATKALEEFNKAKSQGDGE